MEAPPDDRGCFTIFRVRDGRKYYNNKLGVRHETQNILIHLGVFYFVGMCGAADCPDETGASAVTRADGILIIPQEKLEVAVSATNPGNTGAIGALIAGVVDSARKNRAEKAAAPIFEQLRDFDFRKAMLDASTSALSKGSFPLQMRLEVDQSGVAKKSAWERSSASAVLFCNVTYRLEGNTLTVGARAEMFPRDASLMSLRGKPNSADPLDDGNAFYRQDFTFKRSGITAVNIKESLSEAASDIAQKLATSLNNGP